MCYTKVSFGTAHCSVANDLLSFNIKKDGDAVTIFTETAMQSKQDVQLTQGGMLLMALLGGGDYHMVSGCASILW